MSEMHYTLMRLKQGMPFTTCVPALPWPIYCLLLCMLLRNACVLPNILQPARSLPDTFKEGPSFTRAA